MRRLSTLILLCLGAGFAAAQELPEPIQRILSGHDINADGLGLLVRAVDAEVPIISHRAQTPFNPASTIKLLTTWVGLATLGPTYSWPTEIYFLGDLNNGRLDGDLGVKGYGDPYLVTEELWKLLAALRRNGLEEISGDLVIDGSYFAPSDGDPGAFDRQPFL